MPDFQPLSDDELNKFDAPVAVEPARISDNELASLDPDPADVKAASQDRARFVRLNDSQRASGQPQISTRADFAPDLSKGGLRNYVSTYSQGDLDLDDSLISKSKFDSESALFEARHPSYRALVRSGVPADQKALDDHVRVLTHLNYTPASPRETLEGVNNSVSDWLGAAYAGKLADPSGQPLPVNPKVPAPVAVDIAAKLINLPRGEWPAVLTSDESSTLEALGGDRFISHVQSTNLTNIRLSRKERLTGEPAREPNVDTRSFMERAVGPSHERTLDLADLEHVSAFARGVLHTTAAARADDAEVIRAAYDQAGTIGLASMRANGFLEHPEQSPTAAAITLGANLVFRALPEAANLATAGGLQSGMDAITGAGKGASLLATGDPDALARRFRATNQRWTRAAALSDPNFGKSPSADVEAVESSFPDLSDDARLELRQNAYGGARSVEEVMRRIPIAGRSEALNKQLGESFGFVFEDPAQAIAMAVGAKHLLEKPDALAEKVRTLYRDRVITKSAAPFATLAADAEATAAEIDKNPALGPKLEAERAAYLDRLGQKIGSIGDARHAQEFATRFEGALKEDVRSLSPDFVAETEKSIADFKAKLAPYADKPLTAEMRSALADMAQPLGELHPIDQHFVAEGFDAVLNKSGSLERIRRGEEALKGWAAGSAAIETPRLMDRPAAAWSQIKTGLLEHSARAEELGRRKTQLAGVFEDTTAGLGHEVAEEQSYLEEHLHQRDAILKSWDSAIRPAVSSAIDLDRHGGTFLAPNPEIKSRLHGELARVLSEQDPAAAERLLRNHRLLLPERAQLLSQVDDLAHRQELETGAVDHPANELRNQLLLNWAEDRMASLETPVERTVLPHESPNTTIHANLEKKLASGEPVRLTQAERDWLNVRRRSSGLQEINDTGPGGLSYFERKIDNSIKRISERESLLQELHAATSSIDAATLDNPKLEISKDLRRRLETHLGEKNTILGKKFLSIAPDASQLEVSALQAMKESLDGYSAEAKAIQAGFVRVASFEASLLNPKALRWEIAARDREARGQFSYEHTYAKKLQAMFGREFSPAERQQLFYDLKEGKARSSEAVSLLQEHRFHLLADAVNAGAISPEQYATWVDAPYAHNFFDRETESKLATIFEKNQARLPPGYKLFKIDPASLKHRIPENGNFFAHAKDSATGKFVTRDGFSTEAEAAAWLEKNVAPGSEASIQRTMPAIEKEIKLGLVADPALSHQRLTEDLAMSTHNARVSASLHAAGQVQRLSDLQAASGPGGAFSAGGDVFTDGSGGQWHRFTGTHNRWLEGKYVSSMGLKYLSETQEGFHIWNAANQGVDDVLGSDRLLDPVTYKPAALVAGFLKKGIRVPGNMAAAALIAMSPKTWISGWRSNLANLAVAGLDMFNPSQASKIARYTKEAFSTARSRVDNPVWSFLEKHDHVRFPDGDGWKRTHEGFSRDVVAALDNDWRAPAAIEARLDRARGELANQIDRPELQAETAAHIARLQGDLAEATKPATRGFWRTISQTAVDFANAGWEAAQGKGKLHANLWAGYSWISGDMPTKYALAKHLLEDLKLPEEQASGIIFDYTQHLHAVPAVAQNLSRSFGGAMYSSFAIDRLRTLRNTLADPAAAGRLAMQMGRLAGWNTLALNSSGVKPEEFLEARSIAAGDTSRSLLADAAALTGSTLIPGQKGVYSMSTGPILWDIFKPSSPLARATSEKIHADGPGPMTAMAADALVGSASKYIGADLLDLLTGPLMTGTDDQGQPMSKISDYPGYLMRMLVPGARVVAGREAAAVSRAMDEKEVDLNTNRRKPMLETVANLLVNVRPEMRSPDRFRLVLNREARDNDDGNKFITALKEDELLGTMVARDATGPTGKVDHARALQTIKNYLIQNPSSHHAADGLHVFDPFDPHEAQTRLDDLAYPQTVRAFRRMGLDTEFTVLRNWLAVDPDGPKNDPAWFAQIRSVLVNKLIDPNTGSQRSVDLSTAKKIFERLREPGNERLSPDAMKTLHSLAALVQVRDPR